MKAEGWVGELCLPSGKQRARKIMNVAKYRFTILPATFVYKGAGQLGNFKAVEEISSERLPDQNISKASSVKKNPMMIDSTPYNDVVHEMERWAHWIWYARYPRGIGASGRSRQSAVTAY
ncbi:hypothetical protein TESG_02839 [Trichophyton tonsurans CBS 112818]|uniref:Uncharacterized protein n=1 Tax=Trichophyton tonsurans (strain CBS 112818) TaxID=647933 RepID=F2RVK4_TRIT1|nr:hypothetical protein TESG_02839 [Trichophyton tonsurans CBS 112818]